MCKILIMRTRKTNTDEQIDIMQMNTAQEIERAIRYLDANIKTLKKENMTPEELSIHSNEQHCKFILKNLASDLKTDTRL